MEKKKINLEPITNKFVKFGKDKIEVKPYLSTEDIASIVLLCNEQYGADSDNFAMVKLVFDMLVIDKCTNIELEGVVSKKEGKTIKTSINVDKDIIERFDDSRLIDVIRPFIVNYTDAWKQVVKSIELKNVFLAFRLLNESIPTGDDIKKSLSTTFTELKEFKEKDPETFNKVLNQPDVEVRKQAIKEYLAEKEDKKTKKISSKKK